MSERDSRLRVREAHAADFDSVWPMFHEVVAAGDTYSYDPDTTREEAFAHWMEKPRQIAHSFFLRHSLPRWMVFGLDASGVFITYIFLRAIR